MNSHILLNSLYVTTPGAYVRLDNDTVRVELEGETKIRVPLQHLGSVAAFGEVMLSTPLIARCADTGVSVVLLDRNGRFKARIEGPVSGNILLRRAQHLYPEEKARELARHIVAAKIHNSRKILQRGAREADEESDGAALQEAAISLKQILPSLARAATLDEIRGAEGEAARRYFGAFTHMIRPSCREAFALNGRTRRPPTDRTNALLSFLYTLLTHDCRSALESAGTDPQFGYLHSMRPGRPSLALDLIEEFRAYLADRLALTLINRLQIQAEDFTVRPGGAVLMSDEARKKLLVAYQERKKEEITHPFLEKKTPLGLLPFLQARLLARTLRGDLDNYMPFTVK